MLNNCANSAKFAQFLNAERNEYVVGVPLETWVLGAILALVGLLVIGGSVGNSEFGLPLLAAGLASTSAGSWIFLSKFRKWIESLQPS